jgi:hypothetical protein
LTGGCPAASHFLLLRQKKVTKEKATPTSPNSRKSNLPDGRRRTRLAFAVLILFFVSEAQTPSPLIRPTDSIFGGAVRGESQKQNRGYWVRTRYYSDFKSGAITIAPYKF